MSVLRQISLTRYKQCKNLKVSSALSMFGDCQLTWCDTEILLHPSPDTCKLCTIKETYCIHIQVYLFVQVHVHLSIGLIIIYIGAFRRHVNYQSKIPQFQYRGKKINTDLWTDIPIWQIVDTIQVKTTSLGIKMLLQSGVCKKTYKKNSRYIEYLYCYIQTHNTVRI